MQFYLDNSMRVINGYPKELDNIPDQRPEEVRMNLVAEIVNNGAMVLRMLVGALRKEFETRRMMGEIACDFSKLFLGSD